MLRSSAGGTQANLGGISMLCVNRSRESWPKGRGERKIDPKRGEMFLCFQDSSSGPHEHGPTFIPLGFPSCRKVGS